VCQDVKNETGGSTIRWCVRVVAAKTKAEAIQLFDASIRSDKRFRGAIDKSDDTYEVTLISDKIIIRKP
jgi:hypothetical protein